MRKAPHLKAMSPSLEPHTLTAAPRPYVLARETPLLLSIHSAGQVLEWFRLNLCAKVLTDPRGQRVSFLDTDLVHLIKLTDRYGKEPKNRRMTIEQMQSGRISLVPGRFDIRRTEELTWARSIIETPDHIVPNWQVMGRANPGDAYIKNFSAPGARPVFRVLVCGHEGLRRRPVTIFPRERFAEDEVRTILWP